MTLTAVHFTPVVKSDDPEFNAEYAQKIVDLISKMDRDEMEIFTTMVVDEVLCDTIEKNTRTLQRHVTETALACIEDIKKSMKTTVLSKGLSAENTPYINAIYELEEIIKGPSPYDYGYVFQESDFKRDPGGRFTKKIHIDPNKPPVPYIQRGALGIPEPQRPFNQHLEVDREADKARYHQEYLQVRDFLNNVAEGSPETSEAYLHLKDKNGIRYAKKITGMPDGDTWNSNVESVEAISARPKGLNIGGAAFGLSSSMDRGTMAGMNRVDRQLPGFANQWDAARNQDTSNARLYGRTKAAGDFLTNVAPFGSSLQIAGAFGSFVGSHGPDAEKILGPGIRRAAYRYRGTEKTPDAGMVEEYDRTVRGATRRSTDLEPEEYTRMRTLQNRALTRAREVKAAKINEGKTGDPSRITGLRVNQERVKDLRSVERDRALVPIEAVKLDNTERAKVMNDVRAKFMAERAAAVAPPAPVMEMGRSVISRHLAESQPDPQLYGLHLDAGNTPPSEGVMIDKDGKIIAQAIGYGDDHYLPFNLKNMKRLNGGEYIRTRSIGGPTSEDIYTGLMMGAKRIQVNSRSGTFVVEFEDDFTGRRRYNDKAKRMVRRYEGLLDSVQSEQVDRASVRPEVRAVFEREIREKYPNQSRRDIREMVAQRIEEYKKDPELDEADEKAIEEHISRETEGMSDTQAERVRQRVWNSWRADKEFKYRLNGVGYGAALDALHEQFPYYLQAHYRPVRDEAERVSLERDKGYVAPRSDRPAEAGQGLHGVLHSYKPGSGTKRSAGAYVFPPSAAPSTPASTETPTATTPEAPKAEQSQEQQLDQALSQAAKRESYAEKGASILRRAIAATGSRWEEERKLPQNQWMDKPVPGELEAHLSTPEGQVDFDVFLRNREKDLLDARVISQKDIEEFRLSAGQTERQPNDPALRYVVGKPREFPGEPAYAENATQEEVNNEMGRVGNGFSTVYPDRRLTAMAPEELAHEINRLRVLRPLTGFFKGVNVRAAIDRLREPGGYNMAVDNAGVMDILRNTDLMDAHVDNLQRMRTLNTLRNRPPSIAPTETKVIHGEVQSMEAMGEAQGLNRDKIDAALSVMEDAIVAEGANRADVNAISRHRDNLAKLLGQGDRGDPITDEDLNKLNSNPYFRNAYRSAHRILGLPFDDPWGNE